MRQNQALLAPKKPFLLLIETNFVISICVQMWEGLMILSTMMPTLSVGSHKLIAELALLLLILTQPTHCYANLALHLVQWNISGDSPTFLIECTFGQTCTTSVQPGLPLAITEDTFLLPFSLYVVNNWVLTNKAKMLLRIHLSS